MGIYLFLEEWSTPKGVRRAHITKHFDEQFRSRFFDVEDLSLHVTRFMLKCKVISGLPDQKPEDYYLWRERSDYILVMTGFMGAFITCYKASISPWFKRSGAASMEWPRCKDVFGEPVRGEHYVTRTKRQLEKFEDTAAKRHEERYRGYEQWFGPKVQ